MLTAAALGIGLPLAALAGPTGNALLPPPRHLAAPRPDLDAKTLARVRAVLAPATDFSKPERFETNGGGATTQHERADAEAFSLPAANLSFEDRSRFALGNGVFRKLWVAAPASAAASDGLGPLFNARGCQNCHVKDGRGRPPQEGAVGAAEGFVLGLSVPASEGVAAFPQTPSEKVLPEPVYGAQLQDFAVGGLVAEGFATVSYTERKVRLAGGETASLRVPAYAIERPAFGPLDPHLQTSPRVAPPMIGLGLLEAIADADLEVLADPDDADGDGVSGRLARAEDFAGTARIGRFGWKAIQPGLREQAAFAFATDMGLSTPPVPDGLGDCTERQAACRALPTGGANGAAEVGDDLLDLVAFYSRHLAVPARRDVADPQVLRGKRVFAEAGCAACHVQKFVTRADRGVEPALRKQLIFPFSDLLLHDMGDGLADGRPQGLASGREWRTPPLWGIGLTKAVNGHTLFLHDGRARSLLEAVLWHGGEAAAARDHVIALPPADRRALVRFLESL